MALHLGDTVPNFTQASTHGEINFYEWASDSWVVLFSHPADYTPVCTTPTPTPAEIKQPLRFDWALYGRILQAKHLTN